MWLVEENTNHGVLLFAEHLPGRNITDNGSLTEYKPTTAKKNPLNLTMANYKDIIWDMKFDAAELNKARKKYNNGLGEITFYEFRIMFIAGDKFPLRLKRKFIIEKLAKPISEEELTKTTAEELLDFTIKILLQQNREEAKDLPF